jgi:hypothetical protein
VKGKAGTPSPLEIGAWSWLPGVSKCCDHAMLPGFRLRNGEIMKKFTLNPSNLAVAREYLRQQMETQSWWPKEQPHLAKEEFLQMQAAPDSLTAWCQKWLNSGQWRQLEKAISAVDRRRS